MDPQIPSAIDVRAKLAAMSRAQLVALAAKTGTPFTTLIKIQRGETEDPRLETVRSIWPELIGAEGAPEPQAEQGVSHG